MHEEAVLAHSGDGAGGGFVERFEVDDAHAGAVEEVAQIAFAELVEVRAVFAREQVLGFVDQAVVVGRDQKQVAVGGHDALHLEDVKERIEEMLEDFEVRKRVKRVVGEVVRFDVEVYFGDFDLHFGFFDEPVAHVAFTGADVEPALFERILLGIIHEQLEQPLGAALQVGIIEIVVGSDAGVQNLCTVVVAQGAILRAE